MAGFHPSSSFKIDRHTVPEGYTFGWKRGGVNLPAKEGKNKELKVRQQGEKKKKSKVTSWTTFRWLAGVVLREEHHQLEHSGFPWRLIPSTKKMWETSYRPKKKQEKTKCFCHTPAFPGMPAHRNHTSKRSQASGEKEHKKKKQKNWSVPKFQSHKDHKDKTQDQKQRTSMQNDSKVNYHTPSSWDPAIHPPPLQALQKTPIDFPFHPTSAKYPTTTTTTCSMQPGQSKKERGISKSWPRREQVHIRCSDCSQMA